MQIIHSTQTNLTTPKYFEAPSFLASHMEPPLEGNTNFCNRNMANPFADTFPDPLCKLNLKETSEFVKSFPMANHNTETRNYLDVSAERRREGVSSVTKRNSVEAPPTPGRPIFSFSAGNLSRKGFPSKWDDAGKWLNNGSSSCHDSPAHLHGLNLKTLESSKFAKQFDGFRPQAEVFAEKSRVTEEKVSKAVSSIHGSVHLEHHISTKDLNVDVLLKDKFTNEVEVGPIFPKYKCLEPTKEGYLFGKLDEKSKKAAATEMIHEVKQRDIGTEMTPLGSSTTSRCHTPFKSTSPARHNTPENRSGPLALYNSYTSSTASDITKLQDCHLAKLHIGAQFDSVVSTWSSREEEEEDISKSLRHFEIGSNNNECRKSVSEHSKACSWEEEERNKRCLRYQREEAKIQAWVNLQNAKAEAQSRKLEVKIERMRADLEEKLMKRMAVVHRKAEEWRAAAQLQHSEQILRAAKESQKIVNRHNSHFNGHRTEYDRGVNTFSPEGRLFQVEYAIEAIKLGSTAIGLKTKEGVVLAVEKRITSPLLEPSSVEKIMEIDDHIGCAMSGLIADARTLVEHARVETQNHRFSYGEPMTVESTTQALCDLALRFGEGDEESMSRPFGVSLLIAGHDENGPSLYYTDPSGTFWQCNAKAIGSGSEGADSSLQEQYNKDITLKEAETIALSILKQVMEEKVTPNNVDIAKVAPTYHLYTPSEVEAVISRL
ncbi:hypothetical protein RHMOL_Rhmol08G0320200 [Rhododendron molle]|uniref:Uncharacterized protein n=2 Tax=Rhododendron molle TaxID=49168 RepID=A0ACC0MW14_RHOML|nr:hypothetical protein RHMOL_Rhmol08G0320200 [Rhododendron molle]KAI8544764.1 hypothetical protein RHMOL_Rhmol08G0320200 [Rhododendron molle]